MGVMTGVVVLLYSFFFVMGLMADRQKEPARIQEEKQAVQLLKEKEAIVRENLSDRPELLTALSLALLAVLLAGLVLDVYLAARRLRGRSWPVPSLALPETAWNGWDVFHAFVFFLFIEAFLFFAQSAYLAFAGFDGHNAPDPLLLISSLLRDLFVALFVWAMVKRRYRQGSQELGLRFQKWTAHARTGVVAYIGVVPVLFLVFILLGTLMKKLAYEPPPQNVVEMYLKDSTAPYLIPLTFFVAILGPVMEEVFFRGFAYKGLRRRFGIWGGAAITSCLFASLHMNAAAFVPIFVLGMFLTALYEISGSLVPSITAHVLHNTIMVALTLGFKGLSS
jgi:membrane protease YdiL (CAAX protease family)